MHLFLNKTNSKINKQKGNKIQEKKNLPWINGGSLFPQARCWCSRCLEWRVEVELLEQVVLVLILLLLGLLDAVDAVSYFCSECLAASLQWWSAWCQDGNAPSADHGSHWSWPSLVR
jgi:hypothetical protein